MAVSGTLDAETRAAFVDYVAETLRARPATRALILDLTELGHLSESGSRVIDRARRHLERRGVRVAVVAEPGSIVADAVGPVRAYDTRRAAIAGQTRPAA